MSENPASLSAKRLRACRENARETLEQIGRLVGVNKSTVLRWERGDTLKINLPTMQRLAEHYRVGARWLMGLEDQSREADLPRDLPPARVIQVPVYGAAALGPDGDIQGAIVDYVPADSRLVCGDAFCFWFSVGGDSMAPVFSEGDLALVDRRTPCADGAYALAAVDGGECRIYRVFHSADGLELHSANPYYPVRRFGEESRDGVQLVGKVLESRRRFP